MTPERWRATYSSPRFAGRTISGTSTLFSTVVDRLQLLDVETCSKEDVNEAIGNKSWTILSCDHCKQEVDAIVTVGEIPDYESSTACICKECARKALEAFDGP